MDRTNPPAARYALNLLLDRDDRLLLLRRVEGAELGPGSWGLPAGKIEAGETPAGAAAREMAEEIGAGHDVTLLRYVGPLRDSYYGGKYEIHLFLRRWQRGNVVLNHEHSAFAWVSREDFRHYPVMDGIDEDIAILGFWPRRYLNAARIPEHLQN